MTTLEERTADAVEEWLLGEYHADYLVACLNKGEKPDDDWEPDVGMRAQAHADAQRLTDEAIEPVLRDTPLDQLAADLPQVAALREAVAALTADEVSDVDIEVARALLRGGCTVTAAHHYETVEGTVWPVDLGEVEWALRYGVDGLIRERMVAASAVAAYSALTDPNISQRDAIAKLKRARAAELASLARAAAHTKEPHK